MTERDHTMVAASGCAIIIGAVLVFLFGTQYLPEEPPIGLMLLVALAFVGIVGYAAGKSK